MKGERVIYLVEDDDNIRELVVYTLCSTGLEATGFALPSEFWAAMSEKSPDLVMLDIMLPGEDGLSILTKLKNDAATARIPVIMLTAKSSEFDTVLGFERGADDYIAKPFGMMELVARVKARLRSSDGARQPEVAEYTAGGGRLTVSPARHSVKAMGKNVPLTFKEFELLCLLLENRGLVLTRDQILTRIWGYAFDGENRTVDVHVRSLRQKLGAAGELIETVRGIGYKIGG